MSGRIFMAPGYYMQGPSCLDRVPETVAGLGGRPALVVDAGVRPLVEERLARGFAELGLTPRWHEVAGDVTFAVIADLAEAARGAAVIVGLGGGRAIDAAKGVARELSRPLVSVPTIASTDAPASRGIAIYDAEHRVAAVLQMPRNPDAVIVDTSIIAAAPVHFLRAGIGDALTKKIEAEAAWTGRAPNKHGTRPLAASVRIAQACHETVLANGLAALAAAEAGAPDPHLEAVVEAILLLAPMAFENSGLSVAHAVAPVLAATPGAARHLHGEHAAYGALVQMLIERRPAAEVEELHGFCRHVGLPTRLSELGLTADAGTIETLVAGIAATPHMANAPVDLSADDLSAAIRTLESRPSER